MNTCAFCNTPCGDEYMAGERAFCQTCAETMESFSGDDT